MVRVKVSIQTELAVERMELCRQVVVLQEAVDHMLEDAKLANIPITEGPIMEYFERLEMGDLDGLRLTTHVDLDLETYTDNYPLIKKWRKAGFHIFVAHKGG